jgi:hypothetical protein
MFLPPLATRPRAVGELSMTASPIRRLWKTPYAPAPLNSDAPDRPLPGREV